MIWYSHINEDSTPERIQLERSGVESAVIVAGSGERAMALLDVPTLKRVFFVDVNPDALELMRSKINALQELSVSEYRALMGEEVCSAAQRVALWKRVGSALQLTNTEIGRGIFSIGALEGWLRRLRPLMLWWLGSSFRLYVQAGMPSPTPRSFPHRRFELLLWLFSLGLTYRVTANRDEAFVGKGADHHVVPDAFRSDVARGELGRNPMAHLVFAGHLRGMSSEDLPWSFRPEVLQRIKDRLPEMEITYVLGDLADSSIDAKLPWSVNSGPVLNSLSDIPSFLTREQCLNVLDRCLVCPGSVAVLRSFLRHKLDMRDGGSDHSMEEHTGMYYVHVHTHNARVAAEVTDQQNPVGTAA